MPALLELPCQVCLYFGPQGLLNVSYTIVCRLQITLITATSPETMVLKSGSEATLLQASKQYDTALKEQNLDKLDSVVDPNYTIHADGITLKVPEWFAYACKGLAETAMQPLLHRWPSRVKCCALLPDCHVLLRLHDHAAVCAVALYQAENTQMVGATSICVT